MAILVDASRDSSVVERDLGTVEGDEARSGDLVYRARDANAAGTPPL